MFFDENGMFCLDEKVAQSPSFQKIMDDQIVTDEEILEQARSVIELYKELETEFTEKQLAKIAEVMVQTGVLQLISQYKKLQELHK